MPGAALAAVGFVQLAATVGIRTAADDCRGDEAAAQPVHQARRILFEAAEQLAVADVDVALWVFGRMQDGWATTSGAYTGGGKFGALSSSFFE